VPTPSPGGFDPKRTKFAFYASVFQARGDRRTNTKNRSDSITTVIEMPKTGGEGVIVAEGSKSAGFACTCRTANSYTVTIGSSGN
jgi:hypothetical protein